MNSKLTRNLRVVLAGSALVGSMALAGTAFAATPTTPAHGAFERPAVVGTVASISGDTLTVNARSWGRGNADTSTTTYTIDGTNATVTKNGASSSLSAVATGDMVMVQGTTSGTSVTATSINDGRMPMMGGRGDMHGTKPATTTPIIAGNGEPVIGGSVTAVTGTTLTVTTKSGTAYTVDASAATVEKSGAASTVANIATGDNVVVQGTVNGTSVTAASVIDQPAPATTTTGSGTQKPEPKDGFLGAIGGFFTHMFGFF